MWWESIPAERRQNQRPDTNREELRTMTKETDSDRTRDREHQEINCLACAHFYITHDAGFPYGCRAAGFKSRSMPSREMYAHSGMDCQFFTGKGSL